MGTKKRTTVGDLEKRIEALATALGVGQDQPEPAREPVAQRASSSTPDPYLVVRDGNGKPRVGVMLEPASKGGGYVTFAPLDSDGAFQHSEKSRSGIRGAKRIAASAFVAAIDNDALVKRARELAADEPAPAPRKSRRERQSAAAQVAKMSKAELKAAMLEALGAE